jgi:hypothetical protein
MRARGLPSISGVSEREREGKRATLDLAVMCWARPRGWVLASVMSRCCIEAVKGEFIEQDQGWAGSYAPSNFSANLRNATQRPWLYHHAISQWINRGQKG